MGARHLWAHIRDRTIVIARRGGLGMGVVGVGGYGVTNLQHILHAGHFDVRALYDVREDVAMLAASRFGFEVAHSYEALLARADTCAVALTVPNPVHVSMVRMAADAGKHVFIEKPLASSNEECAALGEYCRTRGVVLLVGHQLRREPELRRIKRLLDTSSLGLVRFAWGVTCRRYPDDWRRDPLACPGGSMEQLGVHVIDAFNYLFGPPLRCEGACLNVRTSGRRTETGEWAQVTMEHPAGIWSTVVSRYCDTPFSLFIGVRCERGDLTYDGRRLWRTGARGVQRVRCFGPRGATAQFAEFARCIETRQTPETDATTAGLAVAPIASLVEIAGCSAR